MPTYEYECSIHKVFEQLQSIKDKPLEECPMCKKENIKSGPPKKLISKTTFALGSGGVGWAKDSYNKR